MLKFFKLQILKTVGACASLFDYLKFKSKLGLFENDLGTINIRIDIWMKTAQPL